MHTATQQGVLYQKSAKTSEMVTVTGDIFISFIVRFSPLTAFTGPVSETIYKKEGKYFTLNIVNGKKDLSENCKFSSYHLAEDSKRCKEGEYHFLSTIVGIDRLVIDACILDDIFLITYGIY